MKSSYASLEDALSDSTDRRVERPFRCHVHDDSTASACLNTTKLVWICYACGARGRVDSVAIEEDFDRIKDDIFALLEEASESAFTESMLGLYTSGEPHPYWLSRFSEAAIAHFDLGSDPISRLPCYPMRAVDGSLLGMVIRNLDSWPKYLYPAGCHTSRLLWDYTSEHCEHLVLCEGAMDVIAAWEVGVAAVGIYGSRLSQMQLELICKKSPRWVHPAFDNDEAGRRATTKARTMIEPLGMMVSALDWRSQPFYKDLADLPEEKRRNTLQRLLAV